MKRNYPFDTISSILDQDLIKQIAFHEAGHAAAIYLYNKQKQLPPVYFQITIKKRSLFKLILLQVERSRMITLSRWSRADV
jgi:hypothetical protein